MALEGKGYKADANLVLEDEFGTLDTDTPVTTAFPLLTESLTRSPEYLESDTKTGADAAAKAPTLGRLSHVTGQTTSYMDFHNIEEIFHLAVGIVAGAGTVASPLSWEPDEEITASYSLVIDKIKERFQYTGGIIESFTISGSAADQRVMLTVDWIFQKLTRSATALSSVSLTSSEYVKFSQLVFRIGDQSDALASGDALNITDFSITFKNNWRVPEYVSGSNFIVQPIRNLPREVTLSFTAARYNSDAEITAIQTALTNGTKLQADLTFTGGTSPRSLEIKLPELMVSDPLDVPISDMGNLTFSPKLRAYKNTAVATIMTDVTYETLIKLTQTS